MDDLDQQPESYDTGTQHDRRHDDRERARVSEELRSTMELIMAFEDLSRGNDTIEVQE